MNVGQRFQKARFLLWVDGVGGYLVVMSDQVVLGQAVACGRADVPIVGDLSRHHVTIIRQGEGYTIEPHGVTRLAGRRVNEPHPLHDGDEMQLGASLLARFRQPHPLSASARLELLTHHRTHPAADGIILMASNCILGPDLKNHVICRGWERNVVLVREGQQLRCHAQEELEIDGRVVGHQAPIRMDSRVVGSDFCLSLERID